MMAIKNSTNVFIQHLVKNRHVLVEMMNYVLFKPYGQEQHVQKELSDEKPKENKYPMVASEVLGLDSYHFT